MSDRNSIVLSAVELQELTLKPTPGRQRRVLDYVGIPYKVRPDGSLIVLRVHVDHAYDGAGSLGGPSFSQPARPEPRLRLNEGFNAV